MSVNDYKQEILHLRKRPLGSQRIARLINEDFGTNLTKYQVQKFLDKVERVHVEYRINSILREIN